MTRNDKLLKRRDLLSAGASGVLLAGCAQAGEEGGTARTQQSLRLRMVTTWPKNFPGLGTAAERLAKRIETASGGRIKINVFSAGELVPALESFDAVSSGAADMYHGAEYYWQGKNLAFNFFTAMPFGMTFPEQNAWIYNGGGQEIWDKLSARYNIKAFMSANTGTQIGGWFKRPITSLADIRGLKIRIPGLGGAIYRKLGAAAVTLPGSELFPALQSGKIDATEWVGPWNDLAFGFQQVLSTCHWPGFHEPGAALALGINLEKWNAMDESTQSIIASACAAENIASYAEFTYQNARSMKTLIETHKVRFLPFPASVLKGFREASEEVIREAEEKNPLFAEINAHYREWQETASRWMGVAEQGFLNARDGGG